MIAIEPSGAGSQQLLLSGDPLGQCLPLEKQITPLLRQSGLQLLKFLTVNRQRVAGVAVVLGQQQPRVFDALSGRLFPHGAGQLGIGLLDGKSQLE